MKISGNRILVVPTATSVLETGFPADEKLKNRLFDMSVTDDNKLWVGGASTELKLFDLLGHLHHTVSISCKACTYVCTTNK